ncbi:interferon omega-1 [Saimiri boliviensis]|uniref:interferon omega-1 n=1 Tax=Saimiri boliviensis TaxID=27679 RepID=UPI00027F8ED4|nr:interferon omega-1 [Saimiri boliviensis boliviensis]
MAHLFPLLVALVVTSYSPVGSLACDLAQNHGQLNRNILVLLHQMRRISPFLCLKDRRDFSFPQEMVEGSQVQKAQAMSVLHETLQQIFNLFHTEHSSAAWNTTLLDQLHAGLHQQLAHLETCLVQVMGEGESAGAIRSPALTLRRYFRGIQVYLKEKKYSDCAWEVVRVEILRSLFLSTNLQERLRSKDGNLGSS